jgi:two-component system cell cycle response regulator DivK
VKTILIVEDNEDNMDLYFLILKDKYKVIAAYNGTDGLKKVQAEKPDIILLDLSLPDISGLEIAEFVKSSEDLNHISIIALTAHGSDIDRGKAVEAGCDEYVEKPFEIKHLMEVIDSFA